MLLRSLLSVAGLTALLTLWAIAVSADDARQVKAGVPGHSAISTGLPT